MATRDDTRNEISDNKSALRVIFEKLVEYIVDEIVGVISYLNLAYLDIKLAVWRGLGLQHFILKLPLMGNVMGSGSNV